MENYINLRIVAMSVNGTIDLEYFTIKQIELLWRATSIAHSDRSLWSADFQDLRSVRLIGNDQLILGQFSDDEIGRLRGVLESFIYTGRLFMPSRREFQDWLATQGTLIIDGDDDWVLIREIDQDTDPRDERGSLYFFDRPVLHALIARGMVGGVVPEKNRLEQMLLRFSVNVALPGGTWFYVREAPIWDRRPHTSTLSASLMNYADAFGGCFNGTDHHCVKFGIVEGDPRRRVHALLRFYQLREKVERV